MTTTEKVSRRPFQRAPKNQPGPARGAAEAGAVVAVKASAPVDGLTIGGEPRVHLLPPQVIARKKGKAIRRRLALGAVGMLVLVAIAFGLAEVASISASSALASAQAETTQILAQQAKYSNVVKVKADSASILAAQQSTTTQEILWKPFFTKFQATLPADAEVANFAASITASGAAGSATGATNPLQGTFISTVTASISMKQSEISGWLNKLSGLKGFVDATPNSVTKGSAGGNYTIAMTLHFNDDALANRFTKAATK